MDQLEELGSLFLTTNATDICPVGIQGASIYSGIDSTFSIECHKDQLVNDCHDCYEIEVSSNGSISTYAAMNLGNYSRHGSFNGYPLFSMNIPYTDTNGVSMNYANYLYFRKQGNEVHFGIVFG